MLVFYLISGHLNVKDIIQGTLWGINSILLLDLRNEVFPSKWKGNEERHNQVEWT